MKSILLGIVFSILSFSLFAQIRINDLFVKRTSQSVSDIRTQNQLSTMTSAQLLELNVHVIKTLKNQNNTFELTLPTKNGDLLLVLEKTEITTFDFKVNTPQGEVKVKLPTFYKGIIKGEQKSFVALTVTDNTFEGLISGQKLNLTVGRIKNQRGSLHIVYESGDIQNTTPICGGEVTKQIEGVVEKSNAESVNTTLCKAVEIYFEADYQTYIDNGNSVTNVANMVTSIFNNVVQLYANEDVNVIMSELFVWVTPDPYASSASTSTMLTALDSHWNNNGNNFNGDIVHLVSTRGLNGGVAYFYTSGFPSVYNGMASRAVFASCEKSAAKGLSTSLSTSVVNIPTFSWNVEVVAHELGHNFGLPHTHSCTWSNGTTIGPIDNCVSAEGSCSPGPTPPPGGGTIMSYCHRSSTGINFANGFGPLPSAKMRAEVNAATCLTGTKTPKPIAGDVIVCSGGSVQLTATECSGTYEWYNSLTSNNILSNTASYNTPALSVSTSYFVLCNVAGCKSRREEVIVSVFSNATPSPQSTVACGGIGNASLSVSNCTGLSVDWFTVASGGTKIGSGNPFQVTGVLANQTYYVECSLAGCGNTSRVPANVSYSPTCTYCEPQGLDCSDGDRISRFQVFYGSGTLLDQTFSCDPSGFQLFTPVVQVNFEKGLNYNFTIHKPLAFEDGIVAWLDLDRDGYFDPVNEKISNLPFDTNFWTNKSFSFTIPNTANKGLTRLRLKLTYNMNSVDPCSATEGEYGGFYFGDIKDIVVNISGCNTSEIYGAITQAAGTYKASETIESQANVADNTTYQAGKSILLKPGFQAGTAEVFRAQVAGCN